MTTDVVNDLMQIIEKIDTDSKLINEITATAKSVLAKDPNALDNSLVEHILKNHFGESVYDKIQKIYQNIIGT